MAEVTVAFVLTFWEALGSRALETREFRSKQRFYPWQACCLLAIHAERRNGSAAARGAVETRRRATQGRRSAA